MKTINKKVLIITLVIIGITIVTVDISSTQFHWPLFFTAVSASIAATLIFEFYLKELMIEDDEEENKHHDKYKYKQKYEY